MQEYDDGVIQEDAFELGTQAASTASAVLFGRVFTVIVAGIAFILVARLLGPSSYGVYTVAMAVVGFFTGIASLSMGTTFGKFIAEYSSKHENAKIAELLLNGYLIFFVMGLFLVLVALSLSGILASHVLHNSTDAYVLELSAFIIFVSVLFNDSVAALTGFVGLGRSISISVALQVTVQSVVSIALAFMGYGAIAPLIGLLLSYIAGAAYSLQAIFRRVPMSGAKVSLKAIKGILRFAVPLEVSNIIVSIANNITVLVLGLFVATSVIGNIGIVQRTSSLVGAVSDSLGIAILPMFAADMARRSHDPERSVKFFNYAVYVAFLFITPIMLYTILLAKPFTVTVFNGTYSGASLYIAIMSIGVLLGILGTYAVSLLTSANKVKLVAMCYAVIAVVQLAFLAVLVPTFKGIGAVVQMFIIVPLVTAAVFVYAARRSINAHVDYGRILRILLSGIISAAFILPLIYVMGSDYIVLLAAAFVEQLLLYPPVLALTRAATRKDFNILKTVSGRVPLVSTIMGLLVDYSALFCPVSQEGT